MEQRTEAVEWRSSLHSEGVQINLRKKAEAIRARLGFYRMVLAHPRTPRISRWLLGLALAYIISPIDLVPDFIPILGHLDDLIIVPALLILALWFVPSDVIEECRRKAGIG